jgi:DNA-binding MarR family transcriptional regulator
MSFKASNWAKKLRLQSTDKHVLVRLADYADERYQCFPSFRTIARDTGLHESTVKRSVKKLEHKGLLKRERRLRNTDQRWHKSNRYTLLVARNHQAISQIETGLDADDDRDCRRLPLEMDADCDTESSIGIIKESRNSSRLLKEGPSLIPIQIFGSTGITGRPAQSDEAAKIGPVIKRRLQLLMNPQSFDTWAGPMYLFAITQKDDRHTCLWFFVPNTWFSNYWNEKSHILLRAAVEAGITGKIELKFETISDKQK